MIAFILTNPNLRSINKQYRTTDPESLLIDRLRNSDLESFGRLYEMYAPTLFGVIMRIVEQQETAEDLLQEVFIKIRRSFELYNPKRARLFTWMFNIARNTAIDYLRMRSTRNAKATMDITDASHSLDSHSCSMNIDTIGLKELLGNMGKHHQELLDLCYYKGYTHQEIAELLHLPVGTVKTRIRQAILQLRLSFGL